MYPVCRGRPYCLRCGREGGWRPRESKYRRVATDQEMEGWRELREKKPGETGCARERERRRKREGGRGEDCRGRARVMICRVSRSTSDDSDPSSRRETKEGHQESQPGIFLPRPRPRLIPLLLPLFFLSSFLFLFLFNSGASNYNSHETLVPRYLLASPSPSGWYPIAYTFFFPLFHPFA